MAHPNPEDGLVADITEEYKRDINIWKQKAIAYTTEHACQGIMKAFDCASKNKDTSIDNNQSSERDIVQNVNEQINDGIPHTLRAKRKLNTIETNYLNNDKFV
jgi:hypothetical protein